MKKFFEKIAACVLASLMIMSALPHWDIASAKDMPEGYNGFVFDDYDTGKTPDISFIRTGVNATVEEFPGAADKSLALQTTGTGTGYQSHINVPIYSGSNDCVIEASVAYKGTIASTKRFMQVSGNNDAYLTFFSIDNKGNLKLYDGTTLTTLQEGVFCDIALTLCFEEDVFSVKIDGKSVIVDQTIPDNTDNKLDLGSAADGKLVDANNARIQMYAITGDTETFYINYFYAKGEVYVDPDKPMAPMEDVVTNSTVKERLKGYVLMTTKNGNARVNNKVKAIDADNPDVAPTVINGRTLVPLRFIGESFGATVSYDNISGQATIKFDEPSSTIKVTQGSKKYYVNDEEKAFDVPPHNLNGRILVPLRAICEAIGKEVFWDKCGYILIGDEAASYDLNDDVDKRTLDLAVRNLIFESPTAEEVVTTLKTVNPNKDHPRLLFRKEDIPALREKVSNDPVTASYMARVIETADQSLTAATLKHGVTDGIRMLNTSRKAKKQIENTAFAYIITGEKKYADKAISVMLNVCGDNFPDWNPKHFLDVAEMTEGVALGYDMLYDVLTDEQRAIIEKGIAEKSLKQIMDDLTFNPDRERTLKWNSSEQPQYPQNWVSVCVNGCAMGALVIGDKSDDYAQLAGDVISMGYEHVKDLLAEFAPDGAWFEGPKYWLLSYEFFALGFESLQNALGTDYGLTDAPGFYDGAYYLIGSSGPYGVFNLSTCEVSPPDGPEIYWLGDIFNDATLTSWRHQYMKQKNFMGTFKDVLWYRPDLDTDATDNLTLDGMWRGFNISSSRTGFGEDDMYVALHGGDWYGTKSDLDAGTFIMDMFGVRWAYELGAESSTYYGADLSQLYRGRAEGHNVMVFNPAPGWDSNMYAICPIIRHEYNDIASISVTDLTEANAFRGATSVKRGVMVDKAQKYMVVQDEFTTAEPAETYWFMHTLADVEIASDGKSAILSAENKKMYVELLGDNDYKFEKMAAAPLPTSVIAEGGSDDSHLWKLAIHSTDVTEGTITVGLAPLAGDESENKIPYSVKPIDSWQLPEDAQLPQLTSLKSGSTEIELSSGKTIYSVLYDPYYSNAANAFDVSAEGDGDIEITQISDDNNVAKVSITKDGIVNNYYIVLNEAGLDDISFESVSNESAIMTADSLTKHDVQSVYAAHIPQPANAPENTIDGDPATRYSSDLIGTTIDFDLGSVKKINKVGMSLMDGSIRVTRFRIAVSDDGVNWRVVRNYLSTGDTEDMTYYDIGEENTRYVRLIGYGNNAGSDWFSPTEIAFYSN